MFNFKKGTQVLTLALPVVALLSASHSDTTKKHTWQNASGANQHTDQRPAATPTSCATAPISPLIVNVKDKGAKGNASNNDTAAIQSAIDQVANAGGGTVLVPDGTYIVDATKRIHLKSNITFHMSKNTVLKAMANSSDSYDILRLESVSNVNIIGGTLLGERSQHLVRPTPKSQYGMGLDIISSKHIIVEGVTARNCWGDGFYVGGNPASTDIKFCSVNADNNRRQGMSITSVDGLVVQDSIFQHTNGTNPQTGIDIEPNPGYNVVQNVQIIRSQFLDNANAGLEFYGNQPNAKIFNVTIDHNILNGNDGGLAVQYTHGHHITNNIITDKWTGISLLGGSTKNIITGNTVNVVGHGPKRDIISDSGGNILKDNTFVQ